MVYAAIGSPVSLPCLFTDGLIPNTVSWNRISSTTRLPSSFNWSLGSSASATIQRVEDGDEGTYMCSGEMEGLDRGRIKVQRRMELVVTRGEWNNTSLILLRILQDIYIKNKKNVLKYIKINFLVTHTHKCF